ncbi:MDR family MFS transporter [Paraburkholderia caballeronis]|uniref:MFS transporter, DHA2 family, multidrug resistance protein n=1 Tax=Paraburkholderia caballeronis TaxID=416943 RepID=A0A1H7S4E7_9BURK|nr:DHA2 family multidrug resistance protein [Paraburkholderia caballeronis]PXW97260.1 DHA2 family multidrug resistance protein [Paraburkholderia caballeronis]RAJ93780.1 DHA2 family multidrug resistance protein [Paraburkholderia caballeronis]SED59054.1 MFS transporter, DHA2 family, multidrug resistance protein [Paraburkholderia caballeronis]SEL67365.1 MFS transporter, DHA2 family, multidrug resistance protein [Paraburkholderia caballeronis]
MADTPDAPAAANPASAPRGAHAERASAADWIAVAAGALGALMATLDISITNSALPQIQGEIGATGTEGTWISTGYLMSEIVMIPLAAWLTRVFGLRNFLLANSALFIGFSMMCGWSHTLPAMIAGRLGQGFTGGAMIPTAQTIIRTRLPVSQLPVGMTVFGLIVLLGPLLGPVLGGWLAENISWSWCFFINLPVCIALITLLIVGLKPDRPHWREFLHADWVGIAGLAIGLSSLTVVLEEGQRERWFESDLIVSLSAVSFIGMVLIGISQVTAKKPIMRLSLMRNPRYASVIVIVSAVGAALYGVSYLLPQFLSIVAGYNAEQSGAIMLLSGLPAFLMMPVLPRLLGKVDFRVLVVGGLLLFTLSCMLDIGLTAQSVGHDFAWSQVIRGVAQVLAMMPLNQASMAAVSREDSGDAAGLYNMARNLGGSVGLAIIGTVIDRRTTFHDAMLRESLSANSVIGQDRVASGAANWLAQTGDAAYSQMRSLAQIASQIHVQATVITYSETFWLLGIALLACVPLALLLKKPAPHAPSAGH